MGPIDPWKIDTVRKYLHERFLDREVDDFPRGDRTAVLFEVFERRGKIGEQRRQVGHQLLVTRKFLDRFADRGGLIESLRMMDVAKSMRDAGDRTVELH